MGRATDEGEGIGVCRCCCVLTFIRGWVRVGVVGVGRKAEAAGKGIAGSVSNRGCDLN